MKRITFQVKPEYIVDLTALLKWLIKERILVIKANVINKEEKD
jgi:hypothetical protein